MTRLPRGDQAALDIRKIEDYCLSPAHPRGRHKAARDGEASELAAGAWGSNWRVDVTVERHGRSAVVRTIWIVQSGQNFPSFVTCWVL